MDTIQTNENNTKHQPNYRGWRQASLLGAIILGLVTLFHGLPLQQASENHLARPAATYFHQHWVQTGNNSDSPRFQPKETKRIPLEWLGILIAVVLGVALGKTTQGWIFLGYVLLAAALFPLVRLVQWSSYGIETPWLTEWIGLILSSFTVYLFRRDRPSLRHCLSTLPGISGSTSKTR